MEYKQVLLWTVFVILKFCRSSLKLIAKHINAMELVIDELCVKNERFLAIWSDEEIFGHRIEEFQNIEKKKRTSRSTATKTSAKFIQDATTNTDPLEVPSKETLNISEVPITGEVASLRIMPNEDDIKLAELASKFDDKLQELWSRNLWTVPVIRQIVPTVHHTLVKNHRRTNHEQPSPAIIQQRYRQQVTRHPSVTNSRCWVSKAWRDMQRANRH